jgi:hypothetical protein
MKITIQKAVRQDFVELTLTYCPIDEEGIPCGDPTSVVADEMWEHLEFLIRSGRAVVVELN